MEKAVHAIKEVTIISECHMEGKASHYVPQRMEELPTMFIDWWIEAIASCTTDRYQIASTQMAKFVLKNICQRSGMS